MPPWPGSITISGRRSSRGVCGAGQGGRAGAGRRGRGGAKGVSVRPGQLDHQREPRRPRPVAVSTRDTRAGWARSITMRDRPGANRPWRKEATTPSRRRPASGGKLEVHLRQLDHDALRALHERRPWRRRAATASRSAASSPSLVTSAAIATGDDGWRSPESRPAPSARRHADRRPRGARSRMAARAWVRGAWTRCSGDALPHGLARHVVNIAKALRRLAAVAFAATVSHALAKSDLTL